MKPITGENSRFSTTERKRFTDRIDARNTFQGLLNDAERDPEEFFVLSCYGIAGSGKSRLLQEYRRMLEEDRPHSYVYASYDFENGSDPAQVIHRLTHQLEKNGLVFPLSAAAELTFNEKSGIPVYEEIKEKDVLDNPMLGILGDFVPGVSDLVSAVKKGKELWDTVEGYYRKLKRVWDEDERKLAEELSRIKGMDRRELMYLMPEFFRMDLLRNIRSFRKEGISFPLVIFFDTFENCVNTYETRGFPVKADQWLKNDVVKRLPGILWVIAGREKLSWKTDDPLYEGIVECSLDEFTKEDAVSFLQYAGIPSQLHDHICTVSRGMPLLLDVSVDTYYEVSSTGRIVTEQDLGLNSEDLIRTFLRWMSSEYREIAFVLALLNRWKDEDARKALPEILGTSFRMSDYDQFLEHTIIRKDKDERFYIHDAVREAILDWLRKQENTALVKKVREYQAKQYTLSGTAVLQETLDMKNDLEDLKKQNMAGSEVLDEAERKFQEQYSKYESLKGGGWGPKRTMYTMQRPAAVPAINSIQNHPSLGNEKAFTRIRTADSGQKYGIKTKIYPGETYEIYMYFGNACSPGLKEKGTITGLRARMSVPGGILKPGELRSFQGMFITDNTDPSRVWSDAYIWVESPVYFHYVKDSLKLFHQGSLTKNPVLLDPAQFFSKEGVQIGYDERLSGELPCDDEHSGGYLVFRLEAMQADKQG
ncbi:MAG: hypothetical protein IIY52_04385 [Solobacterium sp.]|nr:hypothetical protein [Solobacterium sp.]